jgi:hypothetical protein
MPAFSRPVWNAKAWRLPSQRMLAKIKQQRRSFRTFLKVGAGVFSANFRRVGQRRDVVRFHPRVPRRARPAVHTTATAAPVQDAGSLRRGACRCRHGAVPHVRAAARHLDTLRHLAGARPRCLRALRKKAQPDWTKRHSPAPALGVILSPPAPLCGAIDAAYLRLKFADATAS